MSIVRVGLAETRNFAQGYDAIFGRRQNGAAKKPKPAKTRAAKPAKSAARSKPSKSKKKGAKRK